MKKILYSSIIFLIFSLLPLVHPIVIKSQTILFQDDFEHGNINGWTVIRNTCKFNNSPAEWTFQNGKYGIIINGGGCNTFNIPQNLNIPINTDYAVEVEITMTPDIYMDRNFSFKIKNLTNWYDLHFYGQTIYFEKVVSGIQHFPTGWIMVYPFQNNITYKIKVEILNSTNEYKIYINDGVLETISENSPFFENSNIALVASAGGTPTSEVWFDNVVVKSLDEPETLLNVPDIKQYSPPWGPQEYDNASNWSPSNPKISRWGCAMTSAAMVLNFHGNNTTPELLNNWLKNNNGYARNGAILWPTVSRYSSLDPDTPKLEFSYLNYSESLAKSEIDLNRPSVLKLENDAYGGNHFVVAKGYSNSDININDPATTKITLAQANSYWGNTLKLGRFRPSNTDLSYIVLFVNEDFDIKVSSESGVIVGDEFYFKEGPMMDPDNPDLDSGVETLNAFYYPKPDIGNYEVEIYGDGVYQLDYYFFNNNGEIKIGSYFGSTTDESSDLLEIYFDNEDLNNIIVSEVNFESVLSFFDDIYKDGYISNHGLYTSIHQLIENSQKNNDKGQGISSKILMELALQKVRFATPQFISDNVSLYLQKQIEILINNLL
ncbi:MAG: hypothetical protein UT24_C0012G0083 [Candidatus Woesebacteria bacterium GW2011_GWB1_39_12]|uniref:Peptidase C39-like domain-containing protein n=2 Tax=Candidatus Woeseibacteriota TaxID=1752722 RepID=A0A0G0Q7X3_9BACT|nr:MAG: hypothetical protein UT23_C0008G0044 [Candidatus Woesebacteria bacterium GW2011_GWA1_39_12]KKR00461.1 MAG: hypothetical protein UT24_C0012G0083 [Candidatus Woesebacteria bacterium GW2011_GWB1_39_12]